MVAVSPAQTENLFKRVFTYADVIGATPRSPSTDLLVEYWCGVMRQHGVWVRIRLTRANYKTASSFLRPRSTTQTTERSRASLARTRFVAARCRTPPTATSSRSSKQTKQGLLSWREDKDEGRELSSTPTSVPPGAGKGAMPTNREDKWLSLFANHSTDQLNLKLFGKTTRDTKLARAALFGQRAAAKTATGAERTSMLQATRACAKVLMHRLGSGAHGALEDGQLMISKQLAVKV